MRTFGLALGSGGARGFAHLGVFAALEDAGLRPDLIVGSSAGAAVGAMYAFRPKAQPNLTHVRRYLQSDLFDTTKLSYLRQSEENRKNFYDKMKVRMAQGAFFAQSLTKNALFTEELLRSNVQFLVPPVNIEESLIPFAAISFDLHTGQTRCHREGPLTEAVMASCAIPGVFPPVALDDQLLMDGGIVHPVPCVEARQLGVDVVIGVDLTPEPDPLPALGSSYEVVMRAADISRYQLKRLQVREADVLISVDLTEVYWADFSHLDRCVEAGWEATTAQLPAIRERLEGAAALPDPTTRPQLTAAR